MQRLVVVMFLASCWRESAPPESPRLSFVARVNAHAELRRGVDELAWGIECAMHGIRALTSEAQREAIRSDLHAFGRDLAHLASVLEKLHDDGEDPAWLAGIEQRLDAARDELARLHLELRHARTLEQQEAFEALKRKLEASHDGPFQRLEWHPSPVAPPQPPDAPLVPRP